LSAPFDVRAALAEGSATLVAAGVPEARLVAELLLGHVLHVERAYLYAYPERTLSNPESGRWRRLLARARRHEPLAYLTHHKEFFGLGFYVDRRVLVPRPDTEVLVEAALAWAKGFAARSGGQPAIVDVGTGSGAIAVSLAVRLPGAKVHAVDLSPGALRVARHNARCHGVLERISFLRGSLLNPLAHPVDLICANLPYVTAAEMAALPPHIAAFEPRLALAGGEDGLDLYRDLLAQAPARLRPGGALLLEIGETQADAAAALAATAFPGAEIDVLPDLAGLPRVLRILTPSLPA
jgi:release factor glutamine methyltransferase